MVVQELQSSPAFTPLWTEACPVGHAHGEMRGSRPGILDPAVRPASAGAQKRPPTRSEFGLGGVPRSAERVRPVASPRGGSVRSVPGRTVGRAPVGAGPRVLPRSASAARACHVVAPSRAGVVDDVPTWVLVSCGIVVGVLMVLALAFLGGPAYA